MAWELVVIAILVASSIAIYSYDVGNKRLSESIIEETVANTLDMLAEKKYIKYHYDEETGEMILEEVEQYEEKEV